MKKMKTLISAVLCLCAVCAMALPAHALEVNISAPGDPEYGKPTSFEPVVTADGGAMKNEDVSKNAALIPPCFGTPPSYVLNTGEYLT
ncbi:MAG: sortase, partial [Oscillospiraceae bacterium]